MSKSVDNPPSTRQAGGRQTLLLRRTQGQCPEAGRPGRARTSDRRKLHGSGSRFGPFHSALQGPQPCLDRALGSGRPLLLWAAGVAPEICPRGRSGGFTSRTPPSSRLEVALVAFSCSGGPPRPLPALPVAHPVTSSPTMDSGGQVPKASPWFRRKLEWPLVPWPSGGSLMAWSLRLCLGVSMSPQ